MAMFHGYVSLPESNHVFFIFAEITQLLIISENCRGQPQAPRFVKVLLGQLLAAEAVPSKRCFTKVSGVCRRAKLKPEPEMV